MLVIRDFLESYIVASGLIDPSIRYNLMAYDDHITLDVIEGHVAFTHLSIRMSDEGYKLNCGCNSSLADIFKDKYSSAGIVRKTEEEVLRVLNETFKYPLVIERFRGVVN